MTLTPGLNRRKAGAMALLAAVLIAPLSFDQASPAQAAEPLEVTDGLYELQPILTDDVWSLEATDSTGAVVGDDVVFRVSDDRRTVTPESADGEYLINPAWLGASGEDAWATGSFDPGSNSAESGAFTLGLRPGEFSGTAIDNGATYQLITAKIDGVAGPGDYMGYMVMPDGTSGKDALPMSADGATPAIGFGTGATRDGTSRSASTILPAQSDEPIPYFVHRFTAPGMYCVTFSMSAALGGDEMKRTVKFAVGDDTPANADCGEATSPGGPEEPGENDVVVLRGHLHADVLYPVLDTDGQGNRTLKLRAHLDDDTIGGSVVDYNDMVIEHTDVIKQQLPSEYTDDADYSYIGEPGSTVWISPRIQQQDVPWIGLSTQSRTLDWLPGSHEFRFRLDAVTGPNGEAAPGDVIIGGIPSTGHTTFSTKTGLPGAWKYPRGGHAHMEWNFTAEGVYYLAFSTSTDVDGVTQEAHGIMTHVVGDNFDADTITPCSRTMSYPGHGGATPATLATGDAPFVLDHGYTNITINPTADEMGVSADQSDIYGATLPTRYVLSDVIFNAPTGSLKGHYGTYSSGSRTGFLSLGLNLAGVDLAKIPGYVNWHIDDYHGPGDLWFDQRGRGGENDRAGTGGPAMDTRADDLDATIAPGFESRTSGVWAFSRPGKYCIDMTWSATTVDGDTLTQSETLTIAVDGPLDPNDFRRGNPGNGESEWVSDGEVWRAAEHGALDATCTQDPDSWTRASEVPVPDDAGPGPDPEDQPWNVPNWSDTESGAKILNLGHVDVASLVTDGVLDTKVKDTTDEGVEHATEHGAAWHEPEDTVFQLLPNSEATVPAREDFRFLGEPGDRIWRVSDTQDFDLLWPGWSTEHIAQGVVPDGVDWKLTGMEGPGDFFLYQLGTEHPNVFFNTADGIDEQDIVPIPERAHAHGSWAFTEEGVYCLAFERTATIDGEAQIDPFTLAVAVGETDPTVIDPQNCEATEPVVTVPDAPAKPSAAVDGDVVTVSWEAPGDGGSAITGYTVQLVGGEQLLVREVPADATEVTFEGVPAGTYTATVVAVNEIGASAASPASDAVTVADATEPEATVPEAPAAPAASVDGTEVTVEWVAPADGGSAITGYRVELTDGNTPVVREAAANATSLVFGNLTPGTYAATVIAINAVGESEKSDPSPEVTVAQVPDPGPEVTVPETPDAPTVTVDGTTVSVAWVAPGDGGSPITGYTVTLTGGSGDPIVQELGTGSTTATFANVPAGTYTATVVAVNAKGSSEASPASAEVTVEAPDTGDPGEEPRDQVTPVPDSELTDANRGGVDVPEAATRGQQITVKVGAGHAGEQVRVWLHSTPVLLGTVTLDAAGNTQVTIPTDAVLGDHKIVVQALDGSLVGWDAIKIGTASQVGPDGEWLAKTGADGGLAFPLVAGAGILLLLGAVILVGTGKRRRAATNGSPLS